MKAKLLVADESPTIHKIVAMAFEKEGLIVEGISRGEHVLEYMVEFQPDVVLADIHLPGLNGYQISHEIKKSGRFAETRVILLTSDFEEADEARLKESLADTTISKPFKSEEIRRIVKEQLESPAPAAAAPAQEAASLIPPRPAGEPAATPNPETPDSGASESEIIDQEYEDIVRQSKKPVWDPREPELSLEEKTVSSQAGKTPDLVLEGIETPPEPEIKIETIAAAPVTEAPSTPPPPVPEPESAPAAIHQPAAPLRDEESSRMMDEVSQQAIREQSLAGGDQPDDLNAVFELLQSGSGLEDSEWKEPPSRAPGSRPNLIEETLALMAHRYFTEETPEPETAPAEIPAGEPVAEAASEKSGGKVIVEEVAHDSRHAPDMELGRRLVEAHVDQVKKHLPEGMADTEAASRLEQTVRQVLGEMGPEIVRKVIQEEIEAIKKMEEA